VQAPMGWAGLFRKPQSHCKDRASLFTVSAASFWFASVNLDAIESHAQ
jgi:hypothetical protein